MEKIIFIIGGIILMGAVIIWRYNHLFNRRYKEVLKKTDENINRLKSRIDAETTKDNDAR